MRRFAFVALPLFAAAVGCRPAVSPPSSLMPSGQAALDRMHATYRCANGIHADAKIDHYGDRGRIRGEMLLYVRRPSSIRMDLLAPPPLSQPIVTLTTDGNDFALMDMREKRFFVGPASACNIARLTTVPIPSSVLVMLLMGEAAVLKHAPQDVGITWSDKGFYVVTVKSTRDAVQEIQLAPRPEDFGKPWSEQRLRVIDVTVKQKEWVRYHAELSEHAPAPMSEPYVDKEGIDPPVPPSGPLCEAEIPRKIHVEVPAQGDDVLFRYEMVKWNPPLMPGVFTQQNTGLPVVPVTCESN
jgi:hypothetical protein